MSHNLPQDLIIEILTRLPVKSLLRFCSVSKSFVTTIKSRSFIKTHLQFHKTNPTLSPPLLIVRSFGAQDCKERYTMCKDNDGMDEIMELDIPFKLNDRFFRLMGCLNGLVCLVDDLENQLDGLIVLWNPVIKRVLKVPKSGVKFDVSVIVYGFGCGQGTSEFKIVRVLYLQERAGGSVVEIFRVRRWEWEELKGCDGLPLIDKRQANVNGVVHWLARRNGNNTQQPTKLLSSWIGSGRVGNENSIVGFDVDREVFGEIKVPVDLLSKHVDVLVLASWRGFLSVFEVEQRGDACLWVMKDYGVEGSWSKRFVMSFQGVPMRIRSLRKNGEIILEQKGILLKCYDPETNEIKDSEIKVNGAFHAFHMKTYVESLVLLDRDDAKHAL